MAYSPSVFCLIRTISYLINKNNISIVFSNKNYINNNWALQYPCALFEFQEKICNSLCMQKDPVHFSAPHCVKSDQVCSLWFQYFLGNYYTISWKKLRKYEKVLTFNGNSISFDWSNGIKKIRFRFRIWIKANFFKIYRNSSISVHFFDISHHLWTNSIT